MSIRHTFIVLVLAMAALLPVHAEIAPEEYRNMQLSADDAITITVTRVKRSGSLFGRTVYVTAQAEVTGVERSASRLSVGDKISIVYEHYKNPKRGWAGPRSIPILKRGEETYAFLRFDHEVGAYVPAARGASFDMLIPII